MALLSECGEFAFQTGALTDAIGAQRYVHEHRSNVLPAEHPDLLSIQQLLAVSLRASGDLVGARALQEQVLDTRQRTLPDDHPDLQRARTNLAGTLYTQQDYAGARVLFEKVLTIHQQSLPDDHPSLQTSRQNVALVAKEAGELAYARELEAKVLAVREKALPEEHPDLQAARLNYAVTLRALGDLHGAHAGFKRVLAVRERTLPDEHPQLQVTRQNLALTLRELGDMNAARALEEQILAVRERTLPEDHPHLIVARQNLAGTLTQLGDYVRSRALFEDVLAARERTLPDDHLELQKARDNLARMLVRIGDLARARVLVERVLTVCERTLPDNHADVQSFRENLATIKLNMGDAPGARELLEKVLSILEQDLPADHHKVQKMRGVLARTMRRQGDLDGARAMQERILATVQETLPEDHPDVQFARVDLAITRRDSGDFVGARELQEKAHAVWRKSHPADYAPLQRTRAELISTLLLMGDIEAAHPLVAALAESISTSLDASLLASPREQLEYTYALQSLLESVLSFLSSHPDASLSRLAFEIVERIRDPAPRGFMDDADETVADLRMRVLESRAKLNDFVAATDGKRADGDRSAEVLEDLVRKRDRADAALRDALRERGMNVKAVDAACIAAALPPDACAVGYHRYLRSTSDTKASPRLTSTVSLLAHVLHRDGKLERVELGPLDAITAATTRWRDAIGKPISPRGQVATREAVKPDDDERAAGAELRRLVLDPVLAATGSARELFVCSDDALHLIALDALPLGDGLSGEVLQIHMEVSFARLCHPRGDPSGVPSFLVLGGVDYQATVERQGDTRLAYAAPPVPSTGDGAALRGEIERSGWRDLPGARREVRALAELFDRTFDESAVLLEGEHASKPKFHAHAPSARFVHLATHGWFAPESVASLADAADQAAAPEATQRPIPSAQWTSMGVQETLNRLAPMTLCGLALAGANRGADSRGRVIGVLTAEELAGIDLSRCALAVLSACETNVGVARAGQGVQSLQAAIHASGARAAITSLWKVDDDATRELFEDFYARIWVDRESVAKGLWNAKMKMRDRGHPTRDWAAWVLTGDPR